MHGQTDDTEFIGPSRLKRWSKKCMKSKELAPVSENIDPIIKHTTLPPLRKNIFRLVKISLSGMGQAGETNKQGGVE